MKNHLIVWIDSDKSLVDVPFWGDLIKEKHTARNDFFPEISSLFAKYNLPALFTSEYKPKLKSWTPEEMKSGLHRIFRIVLKEDKKFPPQLIKAISLIPFVENVKEAGIGVADMPPLAQSMAIPGFDPSTMILLKEAQAFSNGSEAIKIAVLDTGVDQDHPEIAHGTHVCGILAAKGIKISRGVVPGCKIIPVRVLGALKKGNTVVGAGLIDNINNGIKWAVDHDADVINMSLGI